jgi:threonine dehydratase
MVTQVLPPSPAQMQEARRVVAAHLAPTPTVLLTVRDRPIYAKLETLQPVGSFKIRGALCAINAAKTDGVQRVVTSSAGNHGLGVAHAANLLGVPATVVVPVKASAAKVARLGRYDIELLQHGENYDEAQSFAKALATRRGDRFVSPFNDTWVMAGQATVFDEITEQAPQLAHLVVSVGGGGLLSGCLLAADRLDSHVRFSGVQPENSAAVYHVLKGVPMEQVHHTHTIADGLAGGGDVDSATHDIIDSHGVELHLVPETLIRQGVAEAAIQCGLILEGSAAASLAAITEGVVSDDGPIGFIASGRNIATELLIEILRAAN